jgi:hypothetical protein
VLDPGANRWESLLSTGRALFGAAEWWPASRPDAWSTLVAALASKHAGYERPAHRPDQWDDAGLTILRTAPGEHPEIWCRCDAGPHGFMAIAAHGHADALSVEVRHGGVEVLADPGTYCYHGEARWRSYFRSTLGHNTLEVGGRDQSVPGGPFLWLQHARSRRTSPGLVSPDGAATDVLTWSAEHDGYRSLKPPATHRRTVRLWPAARRLEMTDEVDCGDAVSGGEPPFRLAFHFGPGVSAVLDGESLQLAWETPEGAAHSAVMELAPTVTWRLARGEDNPVLGWYSPRFGVKEPAFSVVGQGFGNGAKLVTVLHFGPGIDPRDRN